MISTSLQRLFLDNGRLHDANRIAYVAGILLIMCIVFLRADHEFTIHRVLDAFYLGNDDGFLHLVRSYHADTFLSQVSCCLFHLRLTTFEVLFW